MIHRTEHTDNYTIVSNDILNDQRISEGAKIVLLYMLSCRDDWNFNTKGIASCLNLSVGAVNSRVKELQSAGYVLIKKTRGKRGHFSDCEWDIYETPYSNLTAFGQTEYGYTEYGQTELRSTEYGQNERITNTNNKQVLNITSTKGKKNVFVPPTVEEVSAYCQERGNTIDPEAFVAFYDSKGWKVGKNPMKNWKSAVITWEKRQDKTKARPEKFPDENPFTALRREEGFI